uniref:C2H2-type domain-containing protein n=1 Tax=Heligmosomoides polygyrus TaxID=6339 RepID=A0A183GMK0_HELPZ
LTANMARTMSKSFLGQSASSSCLWCGPACFTFYRLQPRLARHRASIHGAGSLICERLQCHDFC